MVTVADTDRHGSTLGPGRACAPTVRAGDDVARDAVGPAALAEAAALLSLAGLTPTRPRTLVVASLRDRARPATAQQVHAELRLALRGGAERIEPPGLTTVYRVFGALTEHGVVHCFHLAGAVTTAYRLCTAGSHVHLVCRCCGAVRERPAAPWDELLISANAHGAEDGESWVGFAVESARTELIGLCPACSPQP